MQRHKHLVLVLAVALSTLALEASAALPASVATSMTSIGADLQSMFDAVFPLVATGLGLVIVIKLFKRFGNKI